MRVAYWEWSNGSVVTSEGLGKCIKNVGKTFVVKNLNFPLTGLKSWAVNEDNDDDDDDDDDDDENMGNDNSSNMIVDAPEAPPPNLNPAEMPVEEPRASNPKVAEADDGWVVVASKRNRVTSMYSRRYLHQFPVNNVQASVDTLVDMMDRGHGIVMPSKWVAAADNRCNPKA
ncbi:hypothetical protein AAG906_026593 [Vitis piasezkii]